jgi:hypothetical protein
MTEVRVLFRSGTICGVEMSGHTGYDEHGRDIVCAALSTLIQTLETGLADVLSLKGVRSEVREEQGYMSLYWDSYDDPMAGIIADTVVRVLGSIEKSYPSYVKLTEVKLNDDDQSSDIRS